MGHWNRYLITNLLSQGNGYIVLLAGTTKMQFCKMIILLVLQLAPIIILILGLLMVMTVVLSMVVVMVMVTLTKVARMWYNYIVDQLNDYLIIFFHDNSLICALNKLCVFFLSGWLMIGWVSLVEDAYK